MGRTGRCCCPQHEEVVHRCGNFKLGLRKIGTTSRGPIRDSVLSFLNIKRGKAGNHICTACLEYAYGELRKQPKCAPAMHPVATPDAATMGVEEGSDTKKLSMSSEEQANLDMETLNSADAQPPASEPLLVERDRSPHVSLSSSGSALLAAELPASGHEHDASPESYAEVVTTVSGAGKDGGNGDSSTGLKTTSGDGESGDVNLNTALQVVIKALDSGNMSVESLTTLCEGVGQALNGHLLKEAHSLLSEFKDIDSLQALQASEWLEARSQPILKLLKSMTAKTKKWSKSSKPDTDSRNLLPLVHAFESLLACRNSRFVGQFSFSNALVKNTFRKSATANDIDSATTASGSSTTHRNFLEANGRAPNSVHGPDSELWFDNNQVVGRTTRLTVGGKSLMSGCTMVASITTDKSDSDIQQDPCLKPGLFETLDPEQLRRDLQKVDEVEASLNDRFRQFRLGFWEGVLDAVESEQHASTSGWVDRTDIMASQLEANTSNWCCKHCLAVHPVSHAQCPSCSEQVTSPVVSRLQLMYGVQSGHRSACSVKLGEVTDVMPNSYASCRAILGHLHDIAGVGRERQWVSVGCDGQPFDIIRKLLDNSLVCDLCGCAMSPEEADAHRLEKHPGETCDPKKVYDWVLLRPGLGHVEMNAVKVLFRLLWVPILRHVAGLLGFKSGPAQAFIRNCGNNHVSWQLFCVVREAVCKELAVPYVRECLSRNGSPSPSGFLDWAAGVTNNNFILTFKLMDLLVALTMMRAGIRRNDADAMLSGRQKFAPLFYTGQHGTYQRLLLRDMIQRVQAPVVIQRFLRETTSYTVSGDDTRGEGGDFILEAKNRETKAWIPPGQPSLQQWKHASRCSDRLKGVRNSVLRRTGVPQSSYKDATIPIDESVNHVRDDLRRRKYLQQPHVAVDYLTGVTGDFLHPDLVNFDILVRKNYEAFKARMVGEDRATQRLFVECSDDSVEKLTKVEMFDAMASKITSSTHGAEREERLKELRRANSKTKAALRELWEEVMGDVEDSYAADEWAE